MKEGGSVKEGGRMRMNEELMSCRLQLVEGLRLKSLLDDDFFDRMFWIKNFSFKL